MATRQGSRDIASQSPRSVEQITRDAQSYEFNALIGLRYWLRSAGTLLKQAEIYEGEGDDERTYFFLFRHAHLILSNLDRHPDVKDPTTKAALGEAQQEVNRNLGRLDVLKPRINRRYERYLQIVKEREARQRTAAQHARRGTEDAVADGGFLDPGHSRGLHAHENKALAVQLARKEYSRRAASQKALPQADGDSLAQRLQQVRGRLDQGPNQSLGSSKDTRPLAAGTTYHYPMVPGSHAGPQHLTNGPSSRHDEFKILVGSTPLPSLPAKIRGTPGPGPPSKPEKGPQLSSVKAGSSTETTYTFKPAAYLEDGTALRTLFLPPTLRTTFLRIAHPNTLINLETCAFLAGTLVSNALFVSKLVVPAQTATSDTCEMTNESQLFDFVDSQPDLMIVGWIHTHPRQTCFMSSRDLHTHSGYQMMLSESVAIVCAPSQGDTSHGGDWGVYRLTDPPGKMSILSCKKPGIFHPHEVDNVYTDALRPGHVVEAAGLEFEVVDLRN